MAQLNDTLVNGDLRVNGKIYGIITSADSATNASNLGSTAASDFALKNGNYSSNGLIAKSASTAATANAANWTEKSNDRIYRVAFSQDAQFYYSQHFNYNAGTQTLCAKNISSVNITGTVNGNLSGSAASALTSKSALNAGSATNAANAGTANVAKTMNLAGEWTSNSSRYVWFGENGTAAEAGWDSTLRFNPNSNTLSSTNISSTSITGVTTSGTTVKGATVSGTTVYGNTISAGKLTGTQFILVNGSATNNTVTAADKDAVNALDNPKIGFYNVAGEQKGYIIWTDYNNSNIWGNADSSFFGGTNITDGFVVTSDQLNSIFVSRNLSATKFKATTISGTNITAATTVRGTNLSGTNISGASKTASIDNLINSAARAIPTVNNKTITITTGASPATASFTTNTAADKTITLGSMALKASGDYIPNSYSSSTASTFSGKAVSAVNATKLYVTEHSTNNTIYYPVWANGAGNSIRDILTTTAKLQFNPASGLLYISNIVKVGGCSMTWNASTSALDFNF